MVRYGASAAPLGTFICPGKDSGFTSQAESQDQYDLRKEELTDQCKQDSDNSLCILISTADGCHIA